MADLHFVDFALITSPVRKEKQFRLPDDFSKFDFTILSQTSHSVFSFPALFQVFTSWTDRCSAICKVSVLHDAGDAKNFNIFLLSEVEIVAHQPL